MTLNEYQELAQRTNIAKGFDKVVNGALGLAGESGECADILKKHLFQGHDFDKEHLIEEIGDCLWYIAELSSGLCVSLEDVAKANIHKLKLRYPAGFEAERSINREV